MKLDLSIAQRLAVGLALLLFILVAVLVGVSRSHEGSARAQAAFTQQIAPLRDQAFTLERAVYEVGIAARAYLLNPDVGRRDEYQRVVASARDALRALHDVRKTEIGDALYSELAPLVYLYLLQADRLVQDRRGAIDPRTERALGHLRERAVEAIRVFSDYQADQARAALSGMAVARQAVTRDLTLASVLALLFFILLAVLTAESIRRPTQELLRIAHGFEKGHWKSALAWAPHEPRDGEREPRNEMTRLARALGAAAAALERREQRLHADAQVAAATSSSLDKEEIGRAVLLTVVEHISAGCAVLYLRAARTQVLEPLATYGLDGVAGPLNLGQGIPGQAASNGRMVVVQDIPLDTPFQIGFGFERVPPKTVAAVPIAFGSDVLGVLVVASLQAFGESDLSFLRAAASRLGLGVRNALTHEELQHLLLDVGENRARTEGQAMRLHKSGLS